MREPLLGLPAELPVPDDFAAWVCSPRRAVDWLLHAATMDTAAMGIDRSVNPPGISTTIAHMLQALDAGEARRLGLVRRVEDKEIAAIVGALAAGVRGDAGAHAGFRHARTVGRGGPRLRRRRPGGHARRARTAA